MTWVRWLWQSAMDSLLGGWWQLRYTLFGTDPLEFAEGDRTPVLVIQGVYEPWQFMMPVARRLHAAGHPVHHLPGLGHNRMPIPEAAALAARYLEERGLTGVTVVAHSKGGLIGKYLMTTTPQAGRVARLVAIATPFSGSALARYAPGPTLRAFMASDVTLSTLAINLEANSRITSIYGEFDQMVPVRSHLEGAENIELPVVGHFRVLRSPAVLDAVVAAAAGVN